jgi:hypothetical protein
MSSRGTGPHDACLGRNPRAVPGADLTLADGQRDDLIAVLAGGQPQTSPRHRRGMGVIVST